MKGVSRPSILQGCPVPENNGIDFCSIDTESIPLFSHPVCRSFEEATNDMRLGFRVLDYVEFILEDVNEDGVGIVVQVLSEVTKLRECAALRERAGMEVRRNDGHSGSDSVSAGSFEQPHLKQQKKCGLTKGIREHL